MDLLHFVFVCSVLITTCSADEETAVKEFQNLTVLEEKSGCHKREKQYLLEDEPCEGPEQKRDGRQIIPIKNTDSKIINIRLLPKKVPVNIKQIQPPGLSKPVNVRIDNTPQRIPTKIPVILKTKIVPSPAHTMRMKMMEKEFHNAAHNKENTLPSNATDPDIVSKDNNHNTTEITSPETDINKPDEVLSNNNSTDTHHLDDQDNEDFNDKMVDDKDGKKPKTKVIKHEDEDIFTKQRPPIVDKTRKHFKPEPKPVYFFVDEPEPLPAPVKKRKPASKNDKDDEVPPKRSKSIPLVRNKKVKKNEHVRDDDIDTDNDPDIIQITNGTHLISIKKMPQDRRRNEDKFSHDDSEDDVETEERIMNEPLRSEENEKVTLKHKNNDDKMKVEKDKHGCITITKHNYEEFEEKAPNPPAVQATTLSIGSQDPWNYLQIPPNYNNPYYQNIYDNCLPTQTIPPVLQTRENANAYTFTPENSQIYFSNDANTPAYNPEPYQYNAPNNQDTDNMIYQLPRLETLDRIWRAWKDVEIKIRNAQKYDDPFVIDIRRNLADYNDINKGDNQTGKTSLPTSSNNLVNNPVNGYVNNQNTGYNYPYAKPSYRYTH